ncbi:hypothetical protein E2D96_19350 [Salmonella enterica subsp. enterica serovar Oranienburg]|nr:hypothetical protein [Salmonella enterica subsp. enterica serovar Oranienburg]ECF2789666.1 hypothetical protein [Salmonella enterica subsp. enterica serovar Oranienburg]
MVWQNRVQHLHAAGKKPTATQRCTAIQSAVPAAFYLYTDTHPFHDGNPAVSRKFPGRFQSGSQPAFRLLDTIVDSRGGSITRPTEGMLRVWILWVE